MYILTGYIMLFEVKFKFVMHNCKIMICIFTFRGKCITKICDVVDCSDYAHASRAQLTEAAAVCCCLQLIVSQLVS